MSDPPKSPWPQVRRCENCKTALVYSSCSSSRSRGSPKVPLVANPETRRPIEYHDDWGAGRAQVLFTQLGLDGAELEAPGVRLIPEGEPADPDAGPIFFVHWATCTTKRAQQWRAENLV